MTYSQEFRCALHDLKKPFHSMVHIIELFDEMRKDPSLFNTIKTEIRSQVFRAQEIIEDGLMDENTVRANIKPTSLKNIINNVLGEVGKWYSNTESNVAFDLLLNNNREAFLNSVQFERVITNIISNAVEAITIMGNKKDGTVLIETNDFTFDHKDFIEIKISNSGPAIKIEQLSKMFKEVYTNGKVSGKGYGLLSVKRIIDSHNGTISVKNSQKLGGAEFSIIVPASNINEPNTHLN